MSHSVRHPGRLSVLLCVAIVGSVVVAGMAASPASSHQIASLPCDYSQFGHVNPAMKLEGNLVPVFSQASGTLPLQHNPPLAVKGRVPANPSSSFAALNGTSRWCFSIVYQKNQTTACLAGTPPGTSDVCLDTVLHGVYTTAGVVSNQSFSVVARIRFTDNKFCTPSPCTGPYNQSGTGTDLDFGPVPISCATVGTSNDCSVHTTANTVVPGAVQNGFKSSIQIFRVRCTKGTTVVCQQGISWN